MKLKNSLKTNLWLYLSVFSLLILIFLWAFQILFLNVYYENSKTKELNIAIKEIKKEYNSDINFSNIDIISRDNGICIQIIKNNGLQYNSIAFNKGCIADKAYDTYKEKFVESGLNYGTIKLINTKFNNEVLIKAIKIEDTVYAFASASLVPLDSTIGILKNQFLIVTIVVLVLAFIVGYFISKKLSIPIENINKGVKELAKGNYKVKFKSKESINEIEELANNLNKAANELDQTETLRAELLANVSHDLKTPLTMIKAYAEMVRDMTYKDKKKREANLNVIIDESDRLNNLVNDIIELSQIQSGCLELNKENFDIVILINSIINSFNILGYDFVFNHYSKKVIINADKKRIEQSLYNLINNAVKYTGKDKKIIIDILKTNDKEIKICVSDTGKGIDSKDIKFIWDRYYKADKNYKRSTNGSGIGLSIVKNIFIKHGFKYGVESFKNKGTTFWFIIETDNN